ncbi:hypothetical protein ACJIZ3_018298 [Penstemon smallii]|uniref:Uncharacterized protein n=1 Tax=Penstemon smallii TaxID=265156 RepID=A0ABD3SYT8_9LAMI
MITNLELGACIFFSYSLLFVLGQNLSNCNTTSFSSDYICNENKSQQYCKTYATLRANALYSSLSNLSYYLNINSSELAEANNLSDNTDFLLTDVVLIPIDCKCRSDGFYEAEVKRTAIKGESFSGISDSFEGLTSCKSIEEKNPSLNLQERFTFLVPFKCSCPFEDESSKFLLSYPLKEGDTLSDLGEEFNVTIASIVSANTKYSRTGFKSDSTNLVPFSTLLIPVDSKPLIGFLAKKVEPNSSFRVKDSHKMRMHKVWLIGLYIAIGLVGIIVCIAIIMAAIFLVHRKKMKRQDSIKNGGDLELQKLSLSVRTTSDKKVSFEGSQYNFDDPITETTTPHKMPMEIYSFEELQKATEDFNTSNLIEGSVFHGRLKGKNLTIKSVSSETISRIDFLLFHERIHRHSNIIRFLGTCVNEGHDSFIVYEYAKNGSLKDWIHGGLAIKSHFIASCNCFLNWKQRVKICVDIATGLQYMHHIINPSYIHRNIKSRNIFLDEEFNAKIGNFGMAKCVVNEEEQRNKGYLAPEYENEGIISPSIDVFAYGVVLLEILSGKPPIKQDEERDGSFVKLSDEIKKILKSENAEEYREWMDSALADSYSFDGAVMLANLARSCVEDEPSLRPNAGEIVEKLLRLVEELPEGDQTHGLVWRVENSFSFLSKKILEIFQMYQEIFSSYTFH